MDRPNRKVGVSGLASIIIPCWNAASFTKRGLEAVEKHTSYPYEIIIVDNGSSDGTREVVTAASRRRSTARRRFLAVRNERNLGFAKAVNQGMTRARGGYIVWLNNDVVVTPSWLERLISCAESSPDIAAAGPRAYRIKGPQSVAKINYRDFSELPRFSEAWSLKNIGRIKEVEFLHGFCLLIKGEAASRVGKIDESFGIGHYEDRDLCLRLRKNGYRLAIAEEAFVHHDYHVTFDANKIDWREAAGSGYRKFRAKWEAAPGVSRRELRP